MTSLTHPQEALPLRCVSPPVNEPQGGVKSEVQVQVVPLLPHPKQQQQLEGHKQPTTACSQAPAQLERVKFQGKANPVHNHHMKRCRGHLHLDRKPPGWASEPFWVWW
jgi:hypothetical protein